MPEDDKKKPGKRPPREKRPYTLRLLFRVVGPSLIVIAIYHVRWLAS